MDCSNSKSKSAVRVENKYRGIDIFALNSKQQQLKTTGIKRKNLQKAEAGCEKRNFN